MLTVVDSGRFDQYAETWWTCYNDIRILLLSRFPGCSAGNWRVLSDVEWWLHVFIGLKCRSDTNFVELKWKKVWTEELIEEEWFFIKLMLSLTLDENWHDTNRMNSCYHRYGKLCYARWTSCNDLRVHILPLFFWCTEGNFCFVWCLHG